MKYQFRTFDPLRDLQQVVDLYNGVFGPMRPCYSWPVSVERFADKVLSHWEFRAEGLQLAFDGEVLIGFALAAFRSQPLMGATDHAAGKSAPVFISAVAVAPRYRRRGVGRALIERIVGFATSNGRDRLVVGTNPMAPMAFTIGVQEDWSDTRRFLESVGFTARGMSQNMVRSIVGYRMDEPVRSNVARLCAEGGECRAYQEKDYAALLELLDEHGWAYWHVDMLSKVGRWTQTRPFMEACFLDCATEQIYGPDEIGVVVKNGKMLSFCAQTLNAQTGKAYLGPMLTAPGSRRLGLGTAALQMSLELASRKGVTVCDLWTGVGEDITHFYGKSGFQQVMTWSDYDMELQ